jgi:hypothetical protein
VDALGRGDNFASAQARLHRKAAGQHRSGGSRCGDHRGASTRLSTHPRDDDTAVLKQLHRVCLASDLDRPPTALIGQAVLEIDPARSLATIPITEGRAWDGSILNAYPAALRAKFHVGHRNWGLREKRALFVPCYPPCPEFWFPL